jgi:hypothetical protein
MMKMFSVAPTIHVLDTGYEVLTAVVIKSSVFWDITSCSALLVTSFILVSYPAYSSAMKMEATCSSEMSVDFQQTTLPHITENSALHTADDLCNLNSRYKLQYGSSQCSC